MTKTKERTMANEITVDGVVYVPKSAVPKGNRCVVVVDRGWVFAGDVTRKNGRIRIDRAIWVFRWEGIGFDGMIKAPKGGKVQLRPLDQPVDMPEDAEVFCVPVSEDWGI
jgi:hypothetical protein